MKKIFKMLTILFMVSVFVTFLESATPPTCPPSEDPEEFFVFSYHENCSYFYLCYLGMLELLPCPPGLYFCVELGLCSYPDDYQCLYEYYCDKDGPDPGEVPECETPWGRCYKEIRWIDPVTGYGRYTCIFSGDPYESCVPRM